MLLVLELKKVRFMNVELSGLIHNNFDILLICSAEHFLILGKENKNESLINLRNCFCV